MTLIIAHRLSTVRNADLIVVLAEGRIVEMGTREGPIARDGLYGHLIWFPAVPRRATLEAIQQKEPCSPPEGCAAPLTRFAFSKKSGIIFCRMEKPTLILDADDTLWENNIFYEKATDAFIERMAREGFDPEEARHVFEKVEHERVPVVGYAPVEFARSKVIAYHRLCQRHGRLPDPRVEQEVEAIGRQVLDYPIILLEGVAETIPHLHRRCRLLLLTKGDPQVQQDKIARSGLAPFFEAVHVVPEKGPEVLRDLLNHYHLDPRRTWMVGNSPRSDINPALEVGIGAIYIPYAVPWTFEDVPIADPDRVITMRRFSELLERFPEPETPE